MKICSLLLLVIVSGSSVVAQDATYLSHPPMRPLPQPTDRPLPEGPRKYVDPAKGDDGNDGSESMPWRTLQHALNEAAPGETLLLRGGAYYEQIDVLRSGAEGQAITVRSYPGELAVIDGGYREFFEDPENSWLPLEGPDAAEDEFVSAKTYPEFAARPVVHAFPAAGWEPLYGKEDQRPVVLGFFGDSMIPLHSYRNRIDLKDDSMLWDVQGKGDAGEGIYCGPGVWFNRETHRLHARLAHTDLKGLGEHNYRGETDPRKLPLVISAPYGTDILRINGVRHLVFQDLVLRGASSSALINIYGADDITFDGVSVYGGAPGILVKCTGGLKIFHSVFRSLSAPWTSRAHSKYRGTPSYVIITQRAQPLNHDFEWAHNEITDGHDAIWIRYVKNLKFHHNIVENFDDDGIEFGARKGDQEIYLYQNYLSKLALTFTLHEMERDESPAKVDPGSGVFMTRNVIDLREPLFKKPPSTGEEKDSVFDIYPSLCGDHGSPTYPDYYFYHNTVVRKTPSWRGYFGFGMGARGVRGNIRRIFNNLFVQVEGLPGLNFSALPDDARIDGNLHWGVREGPDFEGDFFEKQGRKGFFKKHAYPDDWLKHELFGDPKFAGSPDTDARLDVTLQEASPAIDAGVPLPEEWFDPLRQKDPGKPDIGALPFGLRFEKVGPDL